MRITAVNRPPDNGVSLYILIQLTDSGCLCLTAKSTLATVYTLMDGEYGARVRLQTARENEVPAAKPLSVPLYSPKIPLELNTGLRSNLLS